MYFTKCKTLERTIHLLCILSIVACDRKHEIDYLGQTPPGKTPKIFAPGIVSTDLEEYGCTMSPDGKEFYFTRTFLEPRRHTIMICRKGTKGWSSPEIADFSGNYSEGEPNFSPDGTQLLFGRLRNVPEQNTAVPEIYQLTRTGDGWSAPFYLIPGMFASVSNSHNLFVTDVSGGIQKGDIVKSKFINNAYAQPEKLDGGVNSPFQDAHPFIAPDESFILFDSNRPGGYGDNDLYICVKKGNNEWGDGINLGEPINTPDYDAIPSLSPDGKYLFFYRHGDIYWTDWEIIEANLLLLDKEN